MTITKEVAQKLNDEQAELVDTRGNSFNAMQAELKKFSQELPEEIYMPYFQTSWGPFGVFDYRVTGENLNNLTENIQKEMINQNKVIVRTIQEFNTIYETFAALDKEYIKKIFLSLKAAEEANEKALKGLEGVQINQDDINIIIEKQKMGIQVLKNFKEKLEKIEHLNDVDAIFANISTMQSNVKVIEKNVDTQELVVADLTDEMKILLSSQSVFQDKLNQLKEVQAKQAETVNQRISHQNETISKIEEKATETLNKEIAIVEDKLGDVKRVLQGDIQILSEKVIQSNSEFDSILESTTYEIRKNKSDFENTIQELNIGIGQRVEQMSSHFESEMTVTKRELTELRSLTEKLSKSLMTTQIISFASITIIFVLVILIVSGVL